MVTGFFDANLTSHNWQGLTGISTPTINLRVFPEWQGKGVAELYGMRNVCLWTNDVLEPAGTYPLLTSNTSQYEAKSGALNAHFGSTFKDWDAASPWKALVDGWDIYHLTSQFDKNTVGRSTYFFKVFDNVWKKIWPVNGTPIVPLDVPTIDDGSFVNFVNAENPATSGSAKVFFSLAKPDRVMIHVFDVGGRLIRTVADRQFDAGQHIVTWDGLDVGGRRAPKGVYFTQVKYQNQRFQADKKIIVLK